MGADKVDTEQSLSSSGDKGDSWDFPSIGDTDGDDDRVRDQELHNPDEHFDDFDALADLRRPPLPDSERGRSPTSIPNDDEADDDEADERSPRRRPRSLLRIQARVDSEQKKMRRLAREHRARMEQSVLARRRQLQRLVSDPGFIMSVDKASFVLGVLTLLATEFVLLVIPRQMGALYTALLVPLMVARYVLYRADLFHYFMYDFCYFAQMLMLVYLHLYPDDVRLERALFAIANGPLAFAVVAWRNSLVFHSMDKMTSMFIHVLPPLVTFSRRWGDYISDRELPPWHEPMEADGTVTSALVEFWLNPFLLYAVWQVVYLIKTEVISRNKLRYNTDIMTSLRWLTRKKDSALSKIISRFGERNQLPTFVAVQATYTMVTYLIVPLLWHSAWLHALYLAVIFVYAVANGAAYYFHVFAVRYIEEIGKRVSAENNNNVGNVDVEKS